jgi:hypothetical protein
MRNCASQAESNPRSLHYKQCAVFTQANLPVLSPHRLSGADIRLFLKKRKPKYRRIATGILRKAPCKAGFTPCRKACRAFPPAFSGVCAQCLSGSGKLSFLRGASRRMGKASGNQAAAYLWHAFPLKSRFTVNAYIVLRLAYYPSPGNREVVPFLSFCSFINQPSKPIPYRQTDTGAAWNNS